MKCILLSILLPLAANLQAQPFDLGFEDSLLSQVEGNDRWYTPQEDYLSYTAAIVRTEALQGERALQITAKESKLAEKISDAYSASISQTFDASLYKGQRVRFSAFAKRISGDGEAKLFMTVRRDDRAYEREEAVDPSKTKWKRYEIIADVSPTAKEIVIRVLTYEECSLLFDSLTFEIVDKSVMTEREKRSFYRVVDFYQGFTKLWVYEGEISYITGSSNGGTIIMKNARTHRFNELPQSLIDRVNKRHDEEKR